MSDKTTHTHYVRAPWSLQTVSCRILARRQTWRGERVYVEYESREFGLGSERVQAWVPERRLTPILDGAA